MSDPNQPSVPPGWYPDGQGAQRWWDGTQWTEHTQPGTPEQPSTPQAPAAPGGDMPTVVAPNRAADHPASGGSGQPAQEAQAYGQQPSYGQQGSYDQQQPSYGQQQPSYGGGQPGFGAPGFGAPGQAPFGAPPSGGGKKNKLIALIAGGVVLALILLGLVVWGAIALIGGGGPDDVAKDFVNAELKNDYQKTCELASKDQQGKMQDVLDASDCGDYADKAKAKYDEKDSSCESAYGEKCADIDDDFDYDVKVTDTSTDGDKATVKITVTQTYTGDNSKVKDDMGDDKTQHLTYSMIKEDGDWKVDDEESDDSGASSSSSAE